MRLPALFLAALTTAACHDEIQATFDAQGASIPRLTAEARLRAGGAVALEFSELSSPGLVFASFSAARLVGTSRESATDRSWTTHLDATYSAAKDSKVGDWSLSVALLGHAGRPQPNEVYPVESPDSQTSNQAQITYMQADKGTWVGRAGSVRVTAATGTILQVSLDHILMGPSNAQLNGHFTATGPLGVDDVAGIDLPDVQATAAATAAAVATPAAR